MTWRTHLMGGLAMLWILAPASPDTLALATVAAAMGALLPDLDARQSKLSHTSVYGVTPLKPLSSLLFRSLGHRGALHSLLVWLLVTMAVYLLDMLATHTPTLSIGLSLGYLSHLLLDACTRSGVPLFWPDSARVHLLPYRLRIVTGSLVEDAVFLILALAALALYLPRLSQALLPV
jgi:inner membrane protein